jgi:dihydropteroate synthase
MGEAPQGSGFIDCRGRRLAVGGTTGIMGILNLTPDSFFDGGRFARRDEAMTQARRMEAEGAAVIDVGGESTRPGHAAVPWEEEADRIVPVVEALAKTVAVPISIDTSKPLVARAALRAGGGLLNDVLGLQGDPGMAEVAAEFGCPVVIMHNDAAFSAAPGGWLERMERFFARSLEIARRAGVREDAIILDPGIGFSKTREQNLEILGQVGRLRSLGRPLLLGASRKSVIGRTLGLPPGECLEGTIATTVLAVLQGVDWVRVHDVQANARAIAMTQAVRTSLGGGSSIQWRIA